MGKKTPVEWVTEGQTYIERVETRYIEDGKRTKSSSAVRRGDTEGRDELLSRQLAGDTPTTPYERQLAGDTPTTPYERQPHKVIRKGNEEGGEGSWTDEATPKQKERFQQ